jgi:receptor protein-tyrosine kinase
VKTLAHQSDDPRPATLEGEFDGFIGKVLVNSGTLSSADIGKIVEAQKAGGTLFGETAISLGLLSESDLRRALAKQYAYPYAERETSELSSDLVSAYEAFGEQPESIRALRSQLLLRWFNDQHKTLAITAPRATQGSSTIAANLAIAFAQLGERTLIIDANLRSPRQHELFGLNNSIGLSSVLSDRATLSSAFVNVASFEKLFVMCAGPPPLNPQELLGRLGFSYLIETGPAAFDVIIIDTPPILEFADAQRIVSVAQGCVLSVLRNVTTLTDIESSKKKIAPTGATLLGVVLNK